MSKTFLAHCAAKSGKDWVWERSPAGWGEVYVGIYVEHLTVPIIGWDAHKSENTAKTP